MSDPIPFRRPDIAAQLDVARGLIDASHLDVHAALDLLHALPAGIGVEARAAVATAVRLVSAAGGGGSREAVARYALAQVVVLLERERA